MSNALKFSPDESRGTVRVLPEDAESRRLEVPDRGIGLKPQDMKPGCSASSSSSGPTWPRGKKAPVLAWP